MFRNKSEKKCHDVKGGNYESSCYFKRRYIGCQQGVDQGNGWAAVSIRSVAAKCSVSAGTIYNYYESKAELLGATIESVWQEIFFTRKTSRYFMMLQLAFHGFMNGSNMAISGFRDFSLYIPLVS